jgi:hypothetical protein
MHPRQTLARPRPPELRANPRLIEAAVQNETLSILPDWATFWLIYDQPATRAPGTQVTKIAGVGGAVRDIAAMPKM